MARSRRRLGPAKSTRLDRHPFEGPLRHRPPDTSIHPWRVVADGGPRPLQMPSHSAAPATSQPRARHCADLEADGHNAGQTWPESARFGQIWPRMDVISARVDRCLASVDRSWPMLPCTSLLNQRSNIFICPPPWVVQIWPRSGHILPNSGQAGSNSPDFGPDLVEVGLSMVELGRFRASFPQTDGFRVRADLVVLGPELVNFG